MAEITMKSFAGVVALAGATIGGCASNSQVDGDALKDSERLSENLAGMRRIATDPTLPYHMLSDRSVTAAEKPVFVATAVKDARGVSVEYSREQLPSSGNQSRIAPEILIAYMLECNRQGVDPTFVANSLGFSEIEELNSAVVRGDTKKIHEAVVKFRAIVGSSDEH